MFHKPDSSMGGQGGGSGKKATDTPLRKTDRRKLRQVATAFFASYDTDVSSELFDEIFLHDAQLVVRRVQHAQLNKVQLFFRCPSLMSDVIKDNCDRLWPYTTTTECVWMSVDPGPGEPPIECPSVTMLSLIYNFPAVEIPCDASKYLCRGAHLMRAGILSIPITGNTTLSSNTSSRGIVLAIRVRGNPQPFAVGLFKPTAVREETKGVGVHVWMCYGDDIYRNTTAVILKNQSSSRVNPIGSADYSNGHYGNVGFIDGAVVRPIVRSSNDDDDDDDEEHSDEASDPNQLDGILLKGEGSTAQEDETPCMSPDDVLHYATCRALVNVSDKELPMLLSTFYASHVRQQCPSGAVIQLKQTSYKKFGTYMLHQEKCGLLTVATDSKDKNNPIASLKSIKRSHPDLRGIPKTKKNDNTSMTAAMSAKQIVVLFVIPHWIVNLLQLDMDDVKAVKAKSEERRGTGFLTNAEVCAILDAYYVQNDLITADGTCVILNGPLTDALYKKHTSSCNPVTSITRKDLRLAWMAKMEPAYALVRMPGSQICKMARGASPKVQIEVSRVGGNKLVTRLRGLEDYDVDASGFCKEVAKRFACAGTVIEDDPQLGALKKGHVEIVFQGNLSEELQALLLGDERLSTHGGAKGSDYNLPKQSIFVTLKKGVPAKKRR